MSQRTEFGRKGLLILVLVLGVLVMPDAYAAQRYVVPPGGAEPDGSIIVVPSIQAAIDASAPGDEVILVPGTFVGAGNRDLDFHGKAITVRGTDPLSPSVVEATVIDCGGTAEAPHRGFYFHSGETRDSVVAGLTVKNGYGPTVTWGPWTLSVGGAVYCNESSPTIDHCRFVDNLADDFGGALCNNGGSPAVVECAFTANEAGAGGAVFATHQLECECVGSVEILGCTFAENLAVAQGGAVASNCGGATMTSCTMTGNECLARGGAVYGCTVIDSEIIGNTSCQGGGLYKGGAIGSTIGGNIATGQGGGAYRSGLKGSTIAGNVSGMGGGIYFEGANSFAAYEPTVFSCSIVDNVSTGHGGGIALAHLSNDYVQFSTISHNLAGGNGGGIYCDVGTEPNVLASIIWGNDAQEGPEIALAGSGEEGGTCTLSVLYSDVQGGEEGVYIEPNSTIAQWIDNFDEDPAFRDTDGADGDANTWEDNDYHLNYASPCVNRGVPGDFTGKTDIDGEDRVMGPGADIGADEWRYAKITVDCGDGVAAGAMLPLALLLTSWIVSRRYRR
ncbi:MAG: hypothetical protein JXQ73_20915 [Phycisphaerae bacterium]|nr:hypothetical protein [Phycisphaerae bacterium]